jgi:fructose-1,6-bisphosphatase I
MPEIKENIALTLPSYLGCIVVSLFGLSTFFCLTLGNGVNIFTLDRSIGEFILTHSNVKIPKRGAIYSFNEANCLEWEKPLQNYIHDLRQGSNEAKKTYSSRYIGSMVGDMVLFY